MFIKTIKTPGLAHLSYVIGSQGNTVVIDPRRDVDIYLDIANRNECRISHIFETHRNEDLISGAPILAKLCGAQVLHGPHTDAEISYASTVHQGYQVELGNITLEVVETPGHTKDSISILLFDNDFAEGPAAIFTGDTLFVGDVGRTDFYPQESAHVAGLLYESLQKIKTRAPAAIIYPAHGAGSVCGDGMAEREFSTVAHEIKNNPLLAIKSKDEFIHKKMAEQHYVPPYFSEMERLNSQGVSSSIQPKVLPPLPNKQLNKKHQQGYILIDVRSIESYLGAHITHSYSLPLSMITAYAGWLFNSDDKFVIISDDQDMAAKAALQFSRIGYDHCEYYFSANLAEVSAKGGDFVSLSPLTALEVKQLIEQDWKLLDVRKLSEYEQVHIGGSQHLFLGHLAAQLSKLKPQDKYITMCASGMRATVAAAYLQANGFNNVKVFMGSMGAWQAQDYPVEKA